MIGLQIKDSSGTRTITLGDGTHFLGVDNHSSIRLDDPHRRHHHAQIDISGCEGIISSLCDSPALWRDGFRLLSPQPLKLLQSYSLGATTITVGAARTLAASKQMTSTRSLTPENANTIKNNSADYSENTLKKILQEKLLAYLDRHKRGEIHRLSNAELRETARQAVKAVMDELVSEVPPSVDRRELSEQVVAEAVGLGPLEPLLADSDVSEVMVNGHQKVYIEKNGCITLTKNRFASEKSLRAVIDRIVSPLGRRIDESSPMVDARLEDGSRVNAIIPPLALNGPVLTIRKFSDTRLVMRDLVASRTLSQGMADFLKVCVEQRKNIIVSGGTGSGKTTTLNVLSNFIPAYERIVTVEDAAELSLDQEHVVTLESRPANMEDKGLITIRDLVKNCLRMRPDRIVIGECRGGEALDMLQAMNTGHDGSLTTGHANSPRDLLSRLEVMVLMSGIDLPLRAIREQIASSIDIIIQQMRCSDGRRIITKITQVDGMEGDIILLQDIFTFERGGIDHQGKMIGEHQSCGYAPSFYAELEDAGITLDRALFGKPDTKDVIEKRPWRA